MKIAQFKPHAGLSVASYWAKEPGRRVFICWRPYTSQMFYTRKAVIKFAGYAKGLPTRAALEQFLDELETLDQGRTAPETHHVDSSFASDAALTAADEGDPQDPTAKSRMVT